jgi:predicted transcriptional regulator
LDKRISSEKSKVEARHLNFSSRYFPRFLIKDEEEAILYASSGDESSILNIEDEGLWINDKMFISVLKAFFNQMWQIGVDANLRVDELKTGIPIGETTIIKDPNEAWKKVEQSLDQAKEDVILIASSQSINNIIEKDPFAKYHKNGVKFRLMAPLDLDNLDAAKKLSKIYEIRHVPINYMTMMLIDDRDLFMFGSPPLSDLTDTSFFYLNDTYYTNDRKSSERLSEMLKDTWKRGTEIAEIISQAAGIRLPTNTVPHTETLSNLAKMLLSKNINSALITENGKALGLINDRDLLKEVVQSKRNPEKTLAQDLDYTPLLILKENQTMTDALKMVREKGQKRVAVVKGGQLVGMLTQDMAKRLTEPSKTRAVKN